MPPRAALSARTYRQLHRETYVCPSCLIRAARVAVNPPHSQPRAQWQTQQNISTTSRHAYGENKIPRQPSRILRSETIARQDRRRHASNASLASSTAINAPTSVPVQYKELYRSLLVLQEAASIYVDRSRLQLAIRSLETERPTVRVAFLGLGKGGPLAARKLARVLLSDALGQEEAWERELLDGMNDGRSLLLKYGDPSDGVQSNTLVKTMMVPSRYLDQHNLEILIMSLNANGAESSQDPQSLEDAILVPSLTTPNTTDGRVGFVRYPVQKSIIVAEGVAGALAYGKLPSLLADSSLITAAVDLPFVQLPNDGVERESAPAVNIELATHALELFRTNTANGAQFNDEWQSSRLPSLSDWIAGAKASSGSGMNQAVEAMIASVITSVSSAIKSADELGTAAATAATVPEIKRIDLQSAVADWSAASHEDLQTNLDTAFVSSASWRRTVWWRLFWRIDDVSISASDVLRQSWLTEAEQRLAFLSGRISEAGLASAEQLTELPNIQALDGVGFGTSAVLPQERPMLSVTQRLNLADAPWPQTISLSRSFMLQTLVPELHRKAQALLLSTLSTIVGSSALAAWFYVATSGVALYESGAILSLGLVWSLRRLQKKWEAERAGFASAVREDARRVLGEVEQHLRGLIRRGGRAMVDPVDVKGWQEAREAVERCWEAMEEAARAK